MLVRSGGQVALIDVGPEAAPVTACLSRLGITRIDLLVLTHFDLDHVGGIDAVMGRVGTVLHGPVVEASQRRLIASLEASGAVARETSAGEHGRIGGARWRVLWPRAAGHAYREGNSASVVLDVQFGGLRALFLGDLGAGAQRALAASDALAAGYDVVKVAHHGSADQDFALYGQLHPALALITVGAENDYGHPRDEILDALERGGAVLARTDESGLILVSIEGSGMRVWRDRAEHDDGNWAKRTTVG